jgi:hypothetical protein
LNKFDSNMHFLHIAFNGALTAALIPALLVPLGLQQ